MTEPSKVIGARSRSPRAVLSDQSLVPVTSQIQMVLAPRTVRYKGKQRGQHLEWSQVGGR